MIEEMKFIMLAKKFEEFAEYFNDFYELIDKWIAEKHSDNGETAYITGIAGLLNGTIEYSWECRGCSRGCCGYASGSNNVSFDQLLEFIQGMNKNG